MEEKFVLEGEGMENTELSLDDLEQVAGGTGATRPSGMPCPQCKGFIPVTMQQIITESAIVCPHCGLRLNINHQENQPAIEALKKFAEAQKQFEEQQKKQNQ